MVLASALPSLAIADECAAYYGKGYCTDYVNSRIPIRQGGDANNWPSNMPSDAVARGDVAIFRSKVHVAYVEEVTIRDGNGKTIEVRISEMNWGARRPDTPKSCYVTVNFDVVQSSRRVLVATAEFMRPGGYRPPAKVQLPPAAVDDNTANSTPRVRRRRRSRQNDS